MRGVVLTGLGVVSPFGVGAKAFWNGLAGGTCAIRPVRLIDAEGAAYGEREPARGDDRSGGGETEAPKRKKRGGFLGDLFELGE